MRFAVMATSLLAALVVVPGCTSGGPRVELAEVNGKVTLDGQPLAGVIVTYFPATDEFEGLGFARGTTDAHGRYTLETDGKPGAAVGKNRVVVRWPRERNDDRAAGGKGGQTIPLPYTVANDTPLTVEVRSGSPQAIDLPLKTITMEMQPFKK
jgi:hypothetical protein